VIGSGAITPHINGTRRLFVALGEEELTSSHQPNAVTARWALHLARQGAAWIEKVMHPGATWLR